MKETELYSLLNPIAPAFPVYMPVVNRVFPCIVYTIIGKDSEHSICGNTDGFKRAQIDVFGFEYKDVIEISDAVLDALAEQRQITEQDAYEQGDGTNENPSLFRRILEFYI